MEFLIGIIIADTFEKNKEKQLKKSILIFIPVVFLIFAGIITLVLYIRTVSLFYFNLFAIPTFGLILYLSARIKSSYILFRTNATKVISILSENTYAFFLAQFFTWTFVKDINNNYLHFGNIMLFIFCLLWCSTITVLLHYCIEKPCKKLILKLLF